MFLKDAKKPNALTKSQVLSLEKDLKPHILRVFNHSRGKGVITEKRVTLISVLDILNGYLSEMGNVVQDNYDYHISSQSTYTVISKINRELRSNLLTVKGLEISNMVIISTSTVLDAFEELLGYVKEFEPKLNSSGDVYYIVPSNKNDFYLYRFGLDTLKSQYQTLTETHIL